MVCKVVPKISSPAHRGTVNQQEAPSQEIADYETALDAAGTGSGYDPNQLFQSYGRFSRSALGACACAFFTTGVQNCVMSYVLPAAKCELQLTTYQAGLINMAFMSGGVASAFFWGIVGDVFGRRNVLSLALILDASILLAQSMVTDYRLLLAARSINGFLIGCPSTLVFTYLSDLVGVKKRQFYLNITGMSFVGAWLILPAIAWLVIPFKMADHTILPAYSWRLYLALGSVPGFLSGLWMMTLPESPRLLADTNRGDKAVKLLARIHRSNHGKGAEFKIKKIIQENLFVDKILGSEESRTKMLFMSVLKDLKMFVSKDYAVKSSLILFVFFANMAAGFGLNLWIPELLLRMQGKECRFARLSSMAENARLVNGTADSGPYDHGNDSAFGAGVRSAGEACSDSMDDDVFTSGLIVGACCVLGNAACALLCARGGGAGGAGGARGVRRAAAACALACALACACLAACACSCATSNKIAVAAAAALNAASLNGNVLLIRLLLHALPAKLSGLGVCWGAWWGRAGGVASNLAVGVLLDYSCPAPFIAVAALLTISVGAIMVIKLEEKPSEPQDEADHESQEKSHDLDRYISTHM